MRGTRSAAFFHSLFLVALLPIASSAHSDPAPPTAVIVSDDFEPMQEQWQPAPSGTPIWSVVGGTYRTRGVGDQISVITTYRGASPAEPASHTLNADDYTFRVRMRNQATAEDVRVGIVYQYQDSQNFYRLSVTGGSLLTLERKVQGASTVVTSRFFGVDPKRWTDVELHWKEGKTTVKIDGVVAFADIEQNEFNSGKVGLHADGTWGEFDNIFVGIPFGDQPFNENFSDGIAQDWTPVSGQWSIADGVYADAAVQTTSITLAPIHTAADRTRSLTLRARMLNPYGASGNRIGIVFNYIASGSQVEYNEVVFAPTGVARIQRFANGAFQTLATAQYDGGRNKWFDVTFELSATVSVSVDGVPVFASVDANPSEVPTGRVGLITHWAPGKFDDVSFDHGVFAPFTESFDAGLPTSAIRVGQWSVADGVLRSTSINQTDLVALESHVSTDIVYRARLLNEFGASGNLVGLIYNYQDSGLNAGDYYEAVFSATGIVMVRKVIQGQVYTMATTNIALPSKTWFDVEVVRRGFSTSVKVNGATVIGNVPQAQLGPGRVGVISHWSKARFDDLSVAANAPEQFTQLLDTNIGLDPAELACPVINDSGQVAVRVGWVDGEQAVLRLSADGEFTSVVSTGTQPSGEQISRLAYYGLAINNSGQVLTSVGVPGGELAIRGGAAGYEVLFDTRTDDELINVAAADMNDAGLSLLLGGAGTGFIRFLGVGDGNDPITYLTGGPPGIFHSIVGHPRLDNNGTVVASMNYYFIDNEGEETTGVGVFTIDPNGDATLRVEAYGALDDNISYTNVLPSARNDNDVILFGAGLSPPYQVASILKLEDGALSIVALSQGNAWFVPDGLAINNGGTVVYQTGFPGGNALFVDEGSSDRRIIGTGDALAGSVVNQMMFCRGGLNESNQVAFLARLADGRAGVFLADVN